MTHREIIEELRAIADNLSALRESHVGTLDPLIDAMKIRNAAFRIGLLIGQLSSSLPPDAGKGEREERRAGESLLPGPGRDG